LPARGPRWGCRRPGDQALKGPLFVGEDYELEREVVAFSGSRRTESLGQDLGLRMNAQAPIATMLLNLRHQESTLHIRRNTSSYSWCGMDDSNQRRRSEIGAAVPFECSERFVPVSLFRYDVRRGRAFAAAPARRGRRCGWAGRFAASSYRRCFHPFAADRPAGIAGQRHDLHFTGPLQAETAY